MNFLCEPSESKSTWMSCGGYCGELPSSPGLNVLTLRAAGGVVCSFLSTELLSGVIPQQRQLSYPRLHPLDEGVKRVWFPCLIQDNLSGHLRTRGPSPWAFVAATYLISSSVQLCLPRSLIGDVPEIMPQNSSCLSGSVFLCPWPETVANSYEMLSTCLNTLCMLTQCSPKNTIISTSQMRNFKFRKG